MQENFIVVMYLGIVGERDILLHICYIILQHDMAVLFAV